MTFQMPMAEADFTEDAQNKFKDSVAKAASVSISDVSIDQITPVAARRRLLAESIHVDTSVKAAGTIHLRLYLLFYFSLLLPFLCFFLCASIFASCILLYSI